MMSTHYKFVEKTETECGCILDSYILKGKFVHPDIRYELAVQHSIKLYTNNELYDLPVKYEHELLHIYTKKILKLRKNNQKVVFVIDLSDFPYIFCGFDFRKPVDDAVGKKIWEEEYDPSKHTYVLYINQYVSYALLKLIPFKK
jgi:hypothetical protein